MYGTFMRGYKQVVDALEWIELRLSTFLMGVLVAIVMLEVVSRYFFNRPFPWVLELTMFLFMYIVFIGMPALYKGRSLIILEILFNKLPKRVQQPLLFIWELLIGGFFVYLLIATYRFMSIQTRYRSPTLDISVAYFTLPILLCSILVLIINIYFIFCHLETFLKGRRG